MTYYSKKDLEHEFHIADTTVYRSLKACGLSTTRTKYTAEEVNSRFKIARQLFNAGYTFGEVQHYFGLRHVHIVEIPPYALHEKTINGRVQSRQVCPE